jgi:hypothetical protein
VPVILPSFSDSVLVPRGIPRLRGIRDLAQRHMTLQDTAPLAHGAGERIDVGT